MSRIEILGEADAEGFVVYGVRDKATGNFGYVGQTGYFVKRVRAHAIKGYRGSRTKRVYIWMHEILANGGTVEFVLLDKCADEETSLAREMDWVGRLAAEGHRLTNRWLSHQEIIQSAQAGAAIPVGVRKTT